MREVMDGCKVCGRAMLTDGSPLIQRTCADCKARQRRESNRRLAARRKAERHAAKAEMKVPRCERCGKAIEGANRLAAPSGDGWARRFCGSACRQAAFRARR